LCRSEEQASSGNEISNVLDDRRSFCEQRTVIEHQGWHVPERVYTPIVAAAGDGLCMLVDLDGLERKLGFAKDDVGKQ
jgi:hypothetical protein